MRTRCYGRLIDGQQTDFVWSLYQDHLLIFITQLGSAGTIIAATQDTSAEARVTGVTYSIDTLLGKRDDPGLELCARQIVEFVGDMGHSKPLTLCVGLKNHELATIMQVVAAVKEEHVWS